jgi:predicted ester cyclase
LKLLSVKPTGKRVSWTENHIYRLKADRIAEVWSEADFLSVVSQLRS